MIMSVPPVSSSVISEAASAHTLQAFIELVYVKTANDVMVSQMAHLEEALSTTKAAMDTLTRIQNLHNLVQVKSKGTFLSAYPSALRPGITLSAYRSAASAFFGTPVKVSFSFSSIPDGFDGFTSQRSALLIQLRDQIAALSATTPQVSGREDSNSLLAKLRLVLTDLTPPVISAGTNPASVIPLKMEAIAKWVTDNYNSLGTNATKSGAIQQNITNAITSAQSLNTTQTESVRNFLYIFEQYYKSASAILQQISQIIQKMAGGIAR
jgi:hypothetical protein